MRKMGRLLDMVGEGSLKRWIPPFENVNCNEKGIWGIGGRASSRMHGASTIKQKRKKVSKAVGGSDDDNSGDEEEIMDPTHWQGWMVSTNKKARRNGLLG